MSDDSKASFGVPLGSLSLGPKRWRFCRKLKPVNLDARRSQLNNFLCGMGGSLSAQPGGRRRRATPRRTLAAVGLQSRLFCSLEMEDAVLDGPGHFLASRPIFTGHESLRNARTPSCEGAFGMVLLPSSPGTSTQHSRQQTTAQHIAQHITMHITSNSPGVAVKANRTRVLWCR